MYDGVTFVTQSEIETMKIVITSLQLAFFDAYEIKLRDRIYDKSLDEHAQLRYRNILKAYYVLLNSFDIDPSEEFDADVWGVMVNDCTQEKIDATRSYFSEIVRNNAESNGIHYKGLLRNFFNKIIVNITGQ